jgi:hypothetical protein
MDVDNIDVLGPEMKKAAVAANILDVENHDLQYWKYVLQQSEMSSETEVGQKSAVDNPQDSDHEINAVQQLHAQRAPTRFKKRLTTYKVHEGTAGKSKVERRAPDTMSGKQSSMVRSLDLAPGTNSQYFSAADGQPITRRRASKRDRKALAILPSNKRMKKSTKEKMTRRSSQVTTKGNTLSRYFSDSGFESAAFKSKEVPFGDNEYSGNG